MKAVANDELMSVIRPAPVTEATTFYAIKVPGHKWFAGYTEHHGFYSTSSKICYAILFEKREEAESVCSGLEDDFGHKIKGEVIMYTVTEMVAINI